MVIEWWLFPTAVFSIARVLYEIKKDVEQQLAEEEAEEDE